jgi:hypothetical protein
LHSHFAASYFVIHELHPESRPHGALQRSHYGKQKPEDNAGAWVRGRAFTFSNHLAAIKTFVSRVTQFCKHAVDQHVDLIVTGTAAERNSSRRSRHDDCCSVAATLSG